MATPSPYERPYLTSTAEGILDPEDMVALWVEDLEDLRDSTASAPLSDAEDHFTLLALLGRLQRVRSEYLPSESEAVIRWAEEQARGMSAADFTRALRLFSLEDWAKEVAHLEEDWLDAVIPESEAIDRAVDLLTDWDDFTILFAQGLKRGWLAPDDALSEAGSCEDAALDHSDAFLPASMWIQTMAAALRPDLEESDDVWARTADKFLFLLDLLEDFEKEYRGHPDYIAGQRERLHAWLARQRPLPANPNAPQEKMKALLRQAEEPIVALAADVPSEEVLEEMFHFASADGSYWADVTVPRRADENAVVSVAFRTADGEFAEFLGGMPFWLCGAEGRIDRDATADLPFREVARHLEQEGELSLAVGLRGSLWLMQQ